MLKTFATIGGLILALSLTGQARAQAIPTATTPASLEVGAGYSVASPDYGQKNLQGFTGFADLNIGLHWGVEADAHIVDLITPTDIGENSYMIGPRYRFPFGHFNLYAKGMAGYGNFRVLETQDNQGQYTGYYFAYGLGGGLEYRASEHIVIRAIDVDWQKWPNYAKDGLTPIVYTFGVAYHFR